MGTAIYFDEDAWGTSHLTMKDKDASKMFKDAPMAEAAKRDLATLMDSPPDYFPDLSDEEKKAALLDLSYLDFLTEHAKVHPDVVKYLFNVSSGWWSTGIDLFGCLEAWIAGYPGLQGDGAEVDGRAAAWDHRDQRVVLGLLAQRRHRAVHLPLPRREPRRGAGIRAAADPRGAGRLDHARPRDRAASLRPAGRRRPLDPDPAEQHRRSRGARRLARLGGTGPRGVLAERDVWSRSRPAR